MFFLDASGNIDSIFHVSNERFFHYSKLVRFWVFPDMGNSVDFFGMLVTI